MKQLRKSEADLALRLREARADATHFRDAYRRAGEVIQWPEQMFSYVLRETYSAPADSMVLDIDLIVRRTSLLAREFRTTSIYEAARIIEDIAWNTTVTAVREKLRAAIFRLCLKAEKP